MTKAPHNDNPKDHNYQTHQQLADYVEAQKQKVLKRYTISQLACRFSGARDDEVNTQILADNILKVGLEYPEADFTLTGLRMALNRERDEIVWQFGYIQGGELQSTVIHTETSLGGRRYSLINGIDDIYHGLREEINCMPRIG